MDSATKMRSLARNAMLHVEHRNKRLHTGNAIEGRGGMVDLKGAYEASRGGDMKAAEAALNMHGGMIVDDEPTMHTIKDNSSYCMYYEELIPAVNRRVTVGDQVQPMPNHAGWDMDMVKDGFEIRRERNDGF